MAIQITNRYILKAIYTTFFWLSPIYFGIIITLVQNAYLPATLLISLCIVSILIVLIYTTIKSIKNENYKYIIIDESDIYIVDLKGNEIRLKTTVLEIRNPILNLIFSPNLTAYYLMILRDCYVQFEDDTYYGIDISIADYFRIKKMNLNNVKFFKIRNYIKFPWIY